MSKLFNALSRSDSLITLDDQCASIKSICSQPDALPDLKEQTVVVYVGEDPLFCIKLFVECLKKSHFFLTLSEADTQTLYELRNHLQVFIIFNPTQFSLHKKLNLELNRAESFCLEGGLVVQTSGTSTRIKKFALLSESMLLENSENFDSKVELDNCTSICFTSFEHTSGFNALLIPSLIKNINIVLIQKFPAFKVSVCVAKTHRPLVHVTPMQFSILMQTHFINTIKDKDGTLIIGSSEIRSKTMRLLKEKKIKSYANYGLTEAGPYLLTSPIHVNTKKIGFDIENDKPKNTKIKMTPLNKNQRLFKLSVSGSNLFEGYLNSLSFNRNLDWLETHDIFEEENGKYIFFSRECDLIYESGTFYSALLIEDDILESHPQVEDCSIRKSSLGYSISIQSNKIFEKQLIHNYMHQNHPYLGKKLEVCFVKKIQRTPSGKIIRQ